MNTTYSTNRKLKRVFANILSILVILAIALPVTGTVAAQDETPPTPTPFIWADPFCECVNGWDWQVGDSITIQVFDPDNNQLELQQPTQVYAQDNGVFFELGAEGINLEPGYRITMSDDQITKELIVSTLAVKEMNPVANMISGVFDPNLPLSIHIGDQQPLNLETNNDWWVATFESLNGYGEVSQPDEDGDQTGMGWDGVPNFMRYDIYAFDAQTGDIQRITRLDGTGEYNPTWSPNGKKIAHDVVYWDGSHGIYITDVKTGVSAPLVGADDGGNDAVWSPNGRWIAFDRRWVGDPTLYLVPSGGGDALLIRNDAVSADWAPNGKRVVFQQPSDGSIRTAPVDGGSGGETVINANGENPSWSPDGNWIAYQNGGDIWKVQVNVQGTTFGEPIQMTSGPVWDDGPTWSADSQTIIFQSGMTDDYDLWKVPAAGGMAMWLNGALEFGDYDPAAAKNSTNIAYDSPSPDGQAARLWIADFSYDVGTWTEGEHSYYFENTYSLPEPWSRTSNPITFNVTPDARTYNGYVLLRTLALRARVGSGCPAISPLLNLEQNTRFSYGWGTDFPMTYAEVVDHFNSMVVKAHWDDGMSADLQRHEIFSASSVDFGEIVCSSTEAPPELYPRIVASEAGDWFWMTEFNVGMLDLSLYESAEDDAVLLWSGQTEVTDTWGITFVGNDIHGQDMLPGNYLVVSDGVNSKGLVLESITVDVFDTENEIMAGTAPLGREVWVAAGPQEWQERIMVIADSEAGAWLADFKTIGFDITEDMRGWSSAAIYDEDGDANEGGTPPPPPNPHFVVFPEGEWFDGNDWPDGATVDITVEGKPECATQKESWGYFFNGSFGEGCDVVVGDTVIFTDGTTTRTHVVRNLTITNVDKDANTIAGTADEGALVYAWVHGFGETEMPLTAENGFWLADFDLRDFDLVEGMGGRSEIRDEEGNSTAVDWWIPSPHFSVFPEWDYIEAWDWPVGATVTVAIAGKSECSAEGVSGHPDWDPNSVFVSFWLSEECDVVVGDVVTLTDNVTTRQHTVQNLDVTTVDMDANTITGTADPGAEVHVWPHGYNELLPAADANGNWLADFNALSIDLIKGMNGRTEIRDEVGNATAVEWRIPNTRFTVWPAQNYLEGYEWPDGALVLVSVAGKDACSTEAVSGYPDWDPSNTFFSVNFPEGCNIDGSDLITLTYESISFTHQVQELVIVEVDQDANTVSGTAIFDPKQYTLHTWIHGVEGSYMQLSAEGGLWLADFGAHGFDLQPGWAGRVELVDQDSNATAVEWRILNPYIEAAPFSDWIHAREWPIGTLMTLEIDDPSDGLGDVDYSETATMQQAPWNPGDPNDIVADFRWPDQFAPGPGYVLTMSGDNGQSKTLTISGLNVTGFDLEADTISGTGTPNAQIQICANIPNRCITRWVNTDGGGNWMANYSVPGTGNDDPDTFNVEPGSNGWAADYEADSDRTWFDWWIPNPRFTVFPEWEWFDGYDWPDGATVTITVKDKLNCNTTSQESSGGFFNGGFPEGCDIVVGDEVTFKYGETIRTHVVRNLAITGVDAAEDTVTGTAVRDTVVHVWPHGYNEVTPIANVDGNWTADFTGMGIGLVEGMGGRSEIRDEAGNATAVDWYIPNPRIVVQITDDWFRAEQFAPNTSLNFWLYDALGGNLLLGSTTAQTDSSGTITHWVGDQVNLAPGNHVVVSDGATTRDIVLEALTFDVFDSTQGILQGTAPAPFGRTVWVGIGWENDGWFKDVTTDTSGNWLADFEAPVPSDYDWVAAQIFDPDGDASEVRPTSQIIFLRPRCGDIYTVQANTPLEIRYGSWVAIGEDLAQQNAEHLTVELVLNGETVTGEKQPVVPSSEIPCGTPREDAYGVFFVAELGPLGSGTYIAEATWIFDIAVTDGYDADGDGEPEWYGPGEIFTREFTIIVP